MKRSKFQQEFDKQYITGNEIQALLSVTRTALLYARKRGTLPDAILVHGSGIFIWNRKAIQPFLDSWKISLSVRRGQPVAPKD